jgi:hypothetical protein
MKRSILFWVLLALFYIETWPAPLDVRIKKILESPYDLSLETVRLSGKVIKFTEVRATSSIAYIFQDDYGDEIKIITNKGNYPEFGQRYLLIGIVIIDNTDKENPEIVLSETSRQILGEGWQGNTHTATDRNPTDKKNESLVNVLFAIAAVLLVIIAILAVFMISGRYRESLTPLTPGSSPLTGFPEPAPQGYPEPSGYIEDSAIRMAAPPEGT